MQRSVVRAHPALLQRHIPDLRKRNGNRSQSRNHARLHRMQAPQLSDAEVEAELARPRRVQEVLPLVRRTHAAPGDPLSRYGALDPSAAPSAAHVAAAGSRRRPARAPAGRPVANAGDDESRREPREESRREESRGEESRGGIPGVRFVQEAIAELKKVEWPTQQAVVSGTAVVLVACVIVGVYLYANDQVWKYFVEHVLLR